MADIAITTDLSTTVSTHISKQASDISDSVQHYIDICFIITGFAIMGILGMVANVVNMTVYFKFGLKDSITIGFFALSISDLVVSLAPLFAAFCMAALKIAPDLPVNLISLHYVSFAWLRSTFYSVSCTITTYLSLERCCCVVFPLKVKFIFTRKRTVVVICLVYFAHVLIYAPVFATHQLRWKADLSTNVTTLDIYFLPHRKEVEDFNQAIANIILPIVTQVIVTISAIAMVNGLKKASKFRNRATIKTKSGKDKKGFGKTQKHSSTMDEEDEDEEISSAGTQSQQGDASKTQPGMSAKDARLVQTMVILVIILTACNIPFIMYIFARRFVPGLAINGEYKNLWLTTYGFMYLLAAANASANVIVYYKISARFRRTVWRRFVVL